MIQPGVELDSLLELPRPRSGSRGALRELVGAAEGDFLVGFVGRLAEVKQPWRALAVFELLQERYPRLHLVFVGDGEQRRGLERRIRDLGEQGERRCHLLGARADVPEVLCELDGVLLTSRTEGMPVSLIEAGAAGLPVVARDVGGVSEVCVHERTAWLGETDEELGFGLARLLDDPSEALAMGQRARLRVARQHSAERLAGRLEELYELVVGERRGRLAGEAG